MMMKNFDKDFVVRTKELLAGDLQGKAVEHDVTLQLNCLLALVTLPLERKRDNDDATDIAFKKSCVDYLRKHATILEGEKKEDKYIMMDIRDAIAHLDIQTASDPYGKNIEAIVLTNDRIPKNKFSCSMSVETLKGFALHVTNEYLKYYFEGDES